MMRFAMLFLAGFAGQAAAHDFHGAMGPEFQATTVQPAASRHASPRTAATILRWNGIAIDASGLDHTPVAAGEVRTFGEQLGPGRAARALAIVQIAVFDAVNGTSGAPFVSYTGLSPVTGASPRVAAAQAAHDALVAMFPSQAGTFDAALAEDIQSDSARTLAGIAFGQQAAAAILARRTGDGSEIPEPRVGVEFFTIAAPGFWQQDPVSLIPLALGAFWGQVAPFVTQSSTQFRAPTPPGLDRPEYQAALEEERRLGGDGLGTPTERTDEQTQTGTFWAYDGTPSLCAPPRLYNQVTTQLAAQQGTTDPVDLARLLALVNVAMADAGISLWESKYFYQFWRPVTAFRSTDPTWSPLGAPASNLTGPNFTPPFPAYPSGHAGFGGALFQVLRRFYGTDAIPFTFTSDEFNGITLDNQGAVRPLLPRSFGSLRDAEWENARSRIYLGIHWAFDASEGISQGRQVGEWVFEHAFQPSP